ATTPSTIQPAQGKTPDSRTEAQPNSNAQPNSDTPKTGQPASTGTPAQSPVAPTPAPQAEPKTEILDSSATSGALVTDGHDPILDPAPVPRTTTTLVGGTITSVDRMRNRLTVQIFGGGHWKVNFDERTHIFRNGAETTQLAL